MSINYLGKRANVLSLHKFNQTKERVSSEDMLKQFISLISWQGLDYDLMTKYQDYYDEHKSKTGSYAYLMNMTNHYITRMQERKDYIWDNINCDIEQILYYGRK